MRNIYLITGKEGSGKNTLADKIVGGKTSICFNKFFQEEFRDIEKFLHTKKDFILIDEAVKGNKESIEKIIKFFPVKIRLPYEAKITTANPDIIIVSQDPSLKIKGVTHTITIEAHE
jgi:hypothetical protein